MIVSFFDTSVCFTQIGEGLVSSRRVARRALGLVFQVLHQFVNPLESFSGFRLPPVLGPSLQDKAGLRMPTLLIRLLQILVLRFIDCPRLAQLLARVLQVRHDCVITRLRRLWAPLQFRHEMICLLAAGLVQFSHVIIFFLHVIIFFLGGNQLRLEVFLGSCQVLAVGFRSGQLHPKVLLALSGLLPLEQRLALQLPVVVFNISEPFAHPLVFGLGLILSVCLHFFEGLEADGMLVEKLLRRLQLGESHVPFLERLGDIHVPFLERFGDHPRRCLV